MIELRVLVLVIIAYLNSFSFLNSNNSTHELSRVQYCFDDVTNVFKDLCP